MMKRLLIPLLSGLFLASAAGAQETAWQELVNRKRFAEVLAGAGELSPADSASYTKMYALAQACEGLLKYRQALGYFELCLQMDTASTDAFYALARVSVSLGKTQDAERYYLKALDAGDSADFYANYQLARLYWQMEDYDNAVGRYDFLLQRDMTNTALLTGMGDCYTKAGQLPFAALYYGRAFGTNPENAALGSALINTLLRMGGPSAEEALLVCDTALKHNPGHATLLKNRAMALFVNKRYQEADTVYTSLLARGDSSYVTLTYGGYSRYHGGRYLDAAELLEPAYELDTTSVDVCLFLGSALGKTYDKKRAYVLLDKAGQLMQPDSARVTMLKSFRAETFQKDGRRKEAAALYYELWQENNSRTVALQNIVNMYSAYRSLADVKEEDMRRRILFIYVLYAREELKQAKPPGTFLSFLRKQLEAFVEEAFFKAETTLPTLAPDGKTGSIPVTDLRTLINRLPE